MLSTVMTHTCRFEMMEVLEPLLRSRGSLGLGFSLASKSLCFGLAEAWPSLSGL